LESKEIIIGFLTICGVSVSLLLPGPRAWFHSVRAKPLLSILIILSIIAVFLGSMRGTRSIMDDPVDTVRTFRIIVLCFMSSIALLAALLKRERAGASSSLIWMALYAMLAMLSAFYSKFALLSLYKGFEVAAYVALGLYAGTVLYTWQDLEDTVNIMLFVMWYLIISALMGLLVAPSLAYKFGESGESMAFTMNGVFPAINPNTLTQISGIVAVCALARICHSTKGGRHLGELMVFGIAFLCMLLAHSRTSLFIFVAAAALVLLFYKKTKMLLLIAALGGFASLFLAVADYLVAYILRGQTTDQFATMTGRTEFWPLVIGWVKEAPFLGYGFYSSQRILFGVSSVDQAYLEVLLGLGIVGLTVFCLAVLTVMINLWKSWPRDQAPLQDSGQLFIWTQLVSIFLFIFVRSLTGPSFQILHVNLTIFVLLTVCAAAMVKLKKAEPGAPAEHGAVVSSLLPPLTEPPGATLSEQMGRSWQRGR